MRAELGSFAVSGRVFLHRPRRCAARHWPPRTAPAPPPPPRARGARCRGRRNPARLLPGSASFASFASFASCPSASSLSLPSTTSFLTSPFSNPRPKQANKSIKAGRTLTGESSVPGKKAAGAPARQKLGNPVRCEQRVITTSAPGAFPAGNLAREAF